MIDSIPFLIHQTWSDSEVPGKWRGFQQSWIQNHRGWQYRLWTDLELRELIREHYSWFLPIYDHYQEPIQRVDAARYFLMHRYGGVYADLDFECLRCVEPLLRDREIVLGYEPAEHLSKPVVQAHGLDQVAGNAFIASRAGHPFWKHVFLELVGSHRLSGPLSTTGPFFLTRAIQSFSVPGAIHCVEAGLLYPGTSEEAERGRLRDPAWRERAASRSFAIHHWSGSWVKKSKDSDEKLKPRGVSLPITVTDRGRLSMEGIFILESLRDSLRESPPLVSCLMVTTSSRTKFVERAVACFREQTYPAKELVIVDDGAGDELASLHERLSASEIIYQRLRPESRPLGALRNLAVSRASGQYVMQWDDDDLYHPRRIEAQMAALRSVHADACLLSRWKIWWPRERRLAISKKRGWEGSLLCAKEKLPLYDETLRRGEDSPPVLRLASRNKVVFVDAPWLYTYVVHGRNTTPQASLDEQWAQATEFHWGKSYPAVMRSLAFELPVSVREALLRDVDSSQAQECEEKTEVAEVSSDSTSTGTVPLPKVLILSPVKDGMPFIGSFFGALERLDYPAEKLSLALLESDSADGSFAALCGKIRETRKSFARAEVFKRDYGFQAPENRSDSRLQLQRRSILARSRNYLLARALREEDWVLWLDFDVIDYPRDVIQRLLGKDREIIVPHCVLAPGGRTFDLNTFVQTAGDPMPEEDFHGALAQPPRGFGRKYLEALRDHDLVEVDAVGGTMLLVKADLHREGLHFPVVPYRNHIETEGLSFMARDMGIRSWGMPGLEIIHANR